MTFKYKVQLMAVLFAFLGGCTKKQQLKHEPITQVLVRTINLNFLISVISKSYPRMFFPIFKYIFRLVFTHLHSSSAEYVCQWEMGEEGMMIKPPCFQSNRWINQDAKRKKLRVENCDPEGWGCRVHCLAGKRYKPSQSVLVMWHQQINRPQTECK